MGVKRDTSTCKTTLEINEKEDNPCTPLATVAVMNEAGPCGRLLTIAMSPDVDVYHVTIPRRAHMRRKCSGSEIEGVGGSTKPQNSSKRKEKTDFDKWNSICGAIRDAANLTVEMGSPRVSTLEVVPRVKPIPVGSNPTKLKSC